MEMQHVRKVIIHDQSGETVAFNTKFKFEFNLASIC